MINYGFCHACSNLKSNYGITKPEKDQLIELQGRLCPICEMELQESYQATRGVSNRLNGVVDHCHKSGKVRGILCNQCNRGLGFLKDNVDALKRAIKYLEKDLNG
jgi:hypothetical protein